MNFITSLERHNYITQKRTYKKPNDHVPTAQTTLTGMHQGWAAPARYRPCCPLKSKSGEKNCTIIIKKDT